MRRCLSLIPNSYIHIFFLIWFSPDFINHPQVITMALWVESSPNARCMALGLALQPWLFAASLLWCHHRAFLLGLPAPLAQPFTLGTPWSYPMAPENAEIKPPMDGHVGEWFKNHKSGVPIFREPNVSLETHPSKNIYIKMLEFPLTVLAARLFPISWHSGRFPV